MSGDYPDDWKPKYTHPVKYPASWPVAVAKNSQQAVEDRLRAKEAYIAWERARKRRERAMNAIVVVLLLSIGVCAIKVIY